MRARALAPILALAAAVASCGLLKPADVATKKEVLSAVPTDLPHGRARPATLLVFPPDAKPIYDTTQMAYMTRPFQVDYFAKNEWGEKPSRMMQELLVRTLESTRSFTAVVKPPHTEPYTYALKSEIVAFHQDFTTEPPVMRIAMRFELVSEKSDRVLATKELDVRQPMQEKTPYAGVVAANQASAKLLREVAGFVLEKAG